MESVRDPIVTAFMNIDKVKNDYGYFGLIVMDAYTEVDPFCSYYSEDINPDEYHSYVGKFFQKLIGEGESVLESVRGSFYRADLQAIVGDDEDEVVSKIANLITDSYMALTEK